MPKKKTGKFIKCAICRKEIYVKKYLFRIKKTCSIKCKNKLWSINSKGKNHWNYDKHHSKKVKEKISGSLLGRFKKEESPQWKGGRIKQHGYILIYQSNHPNAIKHCNTEYVLEHRIVAEKCLNRYLTKLEVIHHINGIKDDNRIENLYLFSSVAKHTSYHSSKIKSKLISNL